MTTPGPDYFKKLGTIVQNEVNNISALLEKAGQPQPAFGPDGVANYPREPMIRISRLKLMRALNDLNLLTVGPVEHSYYKLLDVSWLVRHGMAFADKKWAFPSAFTLQTICKYNIVNLVPEDGKISYAELAEKTGKGEHHLRRVIRFAINDHFFIPVGGDAIAHSSFSLALSRDPDAQAWIGHATEDLGKSLMYSADAYGKWGDSPEPSHSGCGIAYGLRPGENSYSYMENAEDGEWGEYTGKGWRAQRFGGAMKYLGMISGPVTLSAFDWMGLGPDATVVDVGGSAGQISMALAMRFPNVKCIVQDLAKIKTVFDTSIPPPFQSRITFQEHDFFQPQPIHDASVYFLKSILHNWSDEKSQEILRNLAPALGARSRILLMESVLPNDDELTVGGTEDVFFMSRRLSSSMDLSMMAIGSKERTKKDWKELVLGAKCGLEVIGFLNRPGSAATLIEVKKTS